MSKCVSLLSFGVGPSLPLQDCVFGQSSRYCINAFVVLCVCLFKLNKLFANANAMQPRQDKTGKGEHVRTGCVQCTAPLTEC